jgi:UDP-N-acetylglucosamine 2-epimerase (non-hydrolysing)
MKKRTVTILSVVGARPNFVKIASFIRALRPYRSVRHVLVHTGQHYDTNMSQQFFEELGIPVPDVNLGVRQSSHATQTGEIMKRFEPVCLTYKPDVVVVVGDVNSTIAAALTAVKLDIKVAHIEAGLRSFDRSMPEEINRVLTDSIADYLFVTEPSAVKNLVREGIARTKIFYVGNTMIDVLLTHKKKAARSNILAQLELTKKGYGVVTLHRPSNVDDAKSFTNIIHAIQRVSEMCPLVFSVHPRTRQHIKKLNTHHSTLRMVPPVGYLDFLCLMTHARFVLTDSGGIQEETSVLHVPCLTVRNNTERPITVTRGTNKVIGVRPTHIVKEVAAVLRTRAHARVRIPLWDGKAAERIARILHAKYIHG